MNGLYRHHGGGLYAVLGVVRDSTNGADEGRRLVLYFSLEKQALHVREIGQFSESVKWPDGQMRPRFDFLEASHG